MGTNLQRTGRDINHFLTLSKLTNLYICQMKYLILLLFLPACTNSDRIHALEAEIHTYQEAVARMEAKMDSLKEVRHKVPAKVANTQASVPKDKPAKVCPESYTDREGNIYPVETGERGGCYYYKNNQKRYVK